MTTLPTLIGQTFGRLTVIAEEPTDRTNGKLARCRCECGMIKAVRISDMLRGRAKSCGCGQITMVKLRNGLDGHHYWNEQRREQLRILALDGKTAAEIGALMDRTPNAIMTAAYAYKIELIPGEPKRRVALDPVRFPQFEDHPKGESDKRAGPKPQRQYDCSLTGNSSAMCSR